MKIQPDKGGPDSQRVKLCAKRECEHKRPQVARFGRSAPCGPRKNRRPVMRDAQHKRAPALERIRVHATSYVEEKTKRQIQSLSS